MDKKFDYRRQIMKLQQFENKRDFLLHNKIKLPRKSIYFYFELFEHFGGTQNCIDCLNLCLPTTLDFSLLKLFALDFAIVI